MWLRNVVFALSAARVLSAQPQLDAEQPTPRERALIERIEQLEKRLTALEAKSESPGTSAAGASPSGVATAIAAAAPDPLEKGSPAPAFASGATLNLYLDGYYGYNFNRPAGRVNLLRANDVLSNNFTLNQASLILERAPDLAAGRRFGARVDLMFGQNTETLQGSAQNEPRPQAYRNIFQAYGTYVFPAGSGVAVDFGKFASALGFENNYAYQEMNYSRSYYFNYLPFYHMGFRTTYKFNDKLSVQHWLVNGANQTEDFNAFKSNAILFTIAPTKSISWNVNYYAGQEGRDLTPIYNPAIPSLPTQPGLATTPAPGRRPNGRMLIFDSYASWKATGKLTAAAEFDHVVSRAFSNSAPLRVTGGAGYLNYRFTPQFQFAGRFEYLGDHGGLFGGVSQALKESTLTATYQPADGIQMRLEWRRDFSNRPFFLTDAPGVLRKEQNTATLGMIWWFGGKRDSW